MLRSLAARTAPRALYPRVIAHGRFYTTGKDAEGAPPDATTAAQADASAPEAAKTSELEDLRLKYDAKDKECAKYKDGYQRAIADFRNLQRTTEREIQKAKDFALQKFARDLVDTVDNFDLALEAVPKDKLEGEVNKELVTFYDGIKMVQDVFEKTLSKHGLVKTNPVGEPFDANKHEATFQVPQPDKEPGTIFHVQRTGFTLHDRVLRAPKVGVVAETE